MKSPAFIWQPRHPLGYLLWPLSQLFRLITALRRLGYRRGYLSSQRVAAPVVVIGNITVGGVGKTPLVIWAANHLRLLGFRPGIVSRGYKGRAGQWPRLVKRDTDPLMVGDEAVMMARRSGCPVAVGPDRVEAARLLLSQRDCNLLLSDDGLQHYALQRDMEVVVLDARRGLGNGLLLPAGPLREGPWRLRHVDLVAVNGEAQDARYSLRTRADHAVNLLSAESRPLQDFTRSKIHAVAGIGDPERFFAMLETEGLSLERHAFPDHHGFREEDLTFTGDLPLLMTEKDAVKCEPFARPDWWYVPLDLIPDADFIHDFTRRVEEVARG